MLVYLDTVICIYAVEGSPSFQARARLATMRRFPTLHRGKTVLSSLILRPYSTGSP
jgi:hypothetical protein